MKQKTGRKLLSFLFALAMVVGLVPGMGLTAYAAFWDGDDTPTITITESQTINESVNIYNANITLTINPGVTLTINADEVRGGITAKGQTLTVTGGGKLVVKAADNNSVGGTGGNGDNATSSAAPGGQGNQGGQGGQGGAAMAGRDGGSISIIVDGGTEVELIGGTGGTGGTGALAAPATLVLKERRALMAVTAVKAAPAAPAAQALLATSRSSTGRLRLSAARAARAARAVRAAPAARQARGAMGPEVTAKMATPVIQALPARL